jgi:phosphopantothenoylcysteine decarboxylase / phosphopantothenate---cysteine ligase
VSRRDGPRILLGVTGSVAAYKAPELCREFRNRGADVAVVLTKAATHFIGAATFEAMTGNPVGVDLFDPRGRAALPTWVQGTAAARGPYHLVLGECADLVLVAPATASILAKMAHGVADDLLTTLLLATTRAVAVAPAMNHRMWGNTATSANVAELRVRGVKVIEPASGKMAWDTEAEGAGRLPEPADLAAQVWHFFETRRQLAGKKIVVSAGGTEEPVDAVRVLGNRSSGKMGVAVAEEARDRGADVVLVAAAMSVPAPAGVRVVPARTAAAMRDAMIAESRDADVIVMAAAVADWRPTSPATRKISKAEGAPVIQLEPTDDVLQMLRETAPSAVRVGFALETDDAIARARAKLETKGLDLIVVNDATEPGAGFEVDTNHVAILVRDGTCEELPTLPKRDVASRLLDVIVEVCARARASAGAASGA